MKKEERSVIRSLPSGVPGLDAVLGAGLPEYSFNLIAGGPGAGKTTFAQQIVFANASKARPALYFTVLGEPTLKMLRYQQQFSFFKPELIGAAVQFINLSQEALSRDLGEVLDRIISEVENTTAGIVVVDSFRTFGGAILGAGAERMAIDHFVQRLAIQLTTWEVSSFLIGEYTDEEKRYPVFTVADGVFWLSQVTDRNSVVRKLQVQKMRGRAPMPGLHTFRITDDGLQIFPRIPEQQLARTPTSDVRQPTGVPGLDEMMGGGIPTGDAVMLLGPSGSGKTSFATQFVAAGLEQGEGVVIAVFEEYPEEYLDRAAARNQQIEAMLESDKLRVIYLRPLDLSVDETLSEISEAVQQIGASRVVIDSLSGFEVALAPGFREDFRESLYRLVGALTAGGITVFMTAETTAGYPDSRLTTERVSFITDDLIVQRFVEIRGELRKVLAIMKMRGSAHARDYRTYEINARGAVMTGSLRDYHGIMTGIPNLQLPLPYPEYAGLTPSEGTVLESLIRGGDSSSDVLAARAGLSMAEVEQALDRLVALGYATLAQAENGDSLYRAGALRT